jgi:hypothetical protein
MARARKNPVKNPSFSNATVTGGGPKVRPSTPKVNLKGGVKAPTKGVSPGAKGGTRGGLIGQPSVSKTPHIQKVSQLPKGKGSKGPVSPTGKRRRK